MDIEVEFEVQLLNIRWVFRGFESLKDLKQFLDARASEVRDLTVRNEPPNAPMPPVIREVAATDG